jgi:hypothetical protein
LGTDIRPHGALSYSRELERAFVDTVSAVTLRRIFDERYVAGRLTLVVAGNASTLSTLKGEIEEFARIPAGARRPDLGDLSWLTGDVRTVASRVGGRHVGYRFPNPGDVSARMRYLICSAVSKRSVEVFIADRSDAVEPDVSVCQTPEEEVWVFDVEGTADLSCGAPAAYQTFEVCLEYLASPEAIEWWRKLIEKDTREYELLDDRPDTVAEQVVWSLVGSAQDSAAPPWAELAGPIDPLEAVEDARRLRERAVVFRVLPDDRRLSMEREAQKHIVQSACADVTTLKGDDAPGGSVAMVLSAGMTVSAAFGLGLSAAIRALKKRFSRVRHGFVFPRKRGRDGA